MDVLHQNIFRLWSYGELAYSTLLFTVYLLNLHQPVTMKRVGLEILFVSNVL